MEGIQQDGGEQGKHPGSRTLSASHRSRELGELEQRAGVLGRAMEGESELEHGVPWEEPSREIGSCRPAAREQRAGRSGAVEERGALRWEQEPRRAAREEHAGKSVGSYGRTVASRGLHA